MTDVLTGVLLAWSAWALLVVVPCQIVMHRKVMRLIDRVGAMTAKDIEGGRPWEWRLVALDPLIWSPLYEDLLPWMAFRRFREVERRAMGAIVL